MLSVMPYERIDPSRITVQPLAERRSFIDIRTTALDPSADIAPLPGALDAQIARLADRMKRAKVSGASVVLAYGAHVIKNGCGPVLIELIRRGYVTHLVTQGAGIIHDWEFAFQATSSESVRDNAPVGRFGTWDEIGRAIHAAALYGASHDMGLGQAVGQFILRDGLGDVRCGHPFKRYSVSAAAAEHGVPLCVLPGVGYDIYCCHPGYTEDVAGAIGRTAGRDFHTLCHAITQLTGGVYLSVGSAIMSPQVFEKAFSIANNLLIGQPPEGQPPEGQSPEVGKAIHDHHIAIVDIQDGGGWDWSQGEPPKEHPAYYLRFCKSFYRMIETPAGRGTVDYLQADNRVVLAGLVRALGGNGG